MYEELYDPLPDTHAYLSRIGLADLTPDGSLEQLNKLIYSHLNTIPFENFDIFYHGKVPSLAVEDLYNKIVVSRRGGCCHELNGLFWKLLVALGYDAYPTGTRVIHGNSITPIVHRATICKIGDAYYYCDVGFGAIAFLSAIPLDGSETPEGFHVEKEGSWYYVVRDGIRVVAFMNVPYEPIDFIYLNYTDSVSENSFFKNTMYAAIMHGAERIELKDDILSAASGPSRHEILRANDIETKIRILREYFGLQIQ